MVLFQSISRLIIPFKRDLMELFLLPKTRGFDQTDRENDLNLIAPLQPVLVGGKSNEDSLV